MNFKNSFLHYFCAIPTSPIFLIAHSLEMYLFHKIKTLHHFKAFEKPAKLAASKKINCLTHSLLTL